MIDLLQGLTTLTPGRGSGTAASVFASSITDRIAKTSGLDAARAGLTDGADAEALAAKSEQLDKLESALRGTADHLAGTFGRNAAGVMMALVEKRVGDGDITEGSLGQAFLDVVKFIDRTFGVDKGDAFIDHLNGTLNDSLNAFFDNGANEKFIATTTPVAAGSVSADLLDTIARDYADSIKRMLEEARGRKSGYGDTDRRGDTNLKGVLVNQVL